MLRSLPPEQAQAWLNSLSDAEALSLGYDWNFWARADQLAPPGDWDTWLCLAGRGWGKTRTGAEWVLQKKNVCDRIALIAPTAADARDVMVEGESGIMAKAPPWDRPVYEPSKRRVTWDNGAQAILYSADEPDRLRGPQHSAGWADELAAWRYLQEAWDMYQFGLRLGRHPQTVVTTTPRPLALIKKLMADPRTAVTRGTTYDNLKNLAPAFRKAVIDRYEGTRLGRQELNAEILDDVPGALWTFGLLDAQRLPIQMVDFERVVVAIDPPVTSGPDADECGIIVAGILGDKGYVIEDCSVQGASPAQWAGIAVDAYNRHHADRIVAEVNQGGELVEQVIRLVDPNASYRAVRASRGKMIRAEPVAALYEQRRVHHIGVFAALEEQMTTYTGEKRESSPDRLDALVWAFFDLFDLTADADNYNFDGML